MSTSTQTPAPKPANPGMLAMRAANTCARLGLQARDADPSAPKPAKAPRAPKTPPAPVGPEALRAFRVVVLVAVGDAQAHVTVDVQAAGPRRAGRAARALALQQGHSPVGVCAVLSDECPQALWRACPVA